MSNSQTVKDTTKTLIIGAMSLVAALAWKDLIKKCFHIWIGDRNSLKKYVLYTLSVTILAIVVICILSRVL